MKDIGQTPLLHLPCSCCNDPEKAKTMTRFLAEKTLGKLVAWLRLLGFDTVFETDASGMGENSEARIRLTRTRRVANALSQQRLIWITPNDPVEQLQQVIAHLGISEQSIQPFSRCLQCNTKLEATEKEAVKGKVPDYIWATHDRFRICRRCDKIYWPGSHTERSLDRISKLFAIDKKE